MPGIPVKAYDPAPVSEPAQGLPLRSSPATSTGPVLAAVPVDTTPLRSLIVLPTYNEIDNLEAMVAAIRQHIDSDILVVDDGSPDGTGALADRLAAADPRVRVLHRAGKLGLGTAYIAGFRDAIANGYDRVFEMDCDFSHPPEDLPRLLAASRGAELVLGSRYTKGGGTKGWAFKRKLLSKAANLYTGLFLSFRIKDWTGGFRCYDVKSLATLDLDRIHGRGYAFQIEMAWQFVKRGYRVLEVPFTFYERRAGQSKMGFGIAREALKLVPTLRFK